MLLPLPACFFAIDSICSWTDSSTSAVSTFALSVEMLPSATCNNKMWLSVRANLAQRTRMPLQ